MLDVYVEQNLEKTLKPEAVRAVGVYLGALEEEIKSLSVTHSHISESNDSSLHQWSAVMVAHNGDTFEAQMTSESSLTALESCLARLRRALLRTFRRAIG